DRATESAPCGRLHSRRTIDASTGRYPVLSLDPNRCSPLRFSTTPRDSFAGGHEHSMCGIIGYVGPKKVDSILLEGLERLEYRGYDSAGISLFDEASGE